MREAWAATVGARLRPQSKAGEPWYEIRAAAEAAEPASTAEVLLYGAIGGWWPEDVDAYELVVALQTLDVAELTVRINSPGGFVDDAVAIYNALRDHPARVTAVVDSKAYSAASFIAQAGDHRVMNRGSEMMIHDAWGATVGPASEMRAYADYLDRQTAKAAGFYAAASGLDAGHWLELMAVESWFDAGEAVAAGLADVAVVDDPPTAPAPEASNALPYRFQSRADAGPPSVSTDTAPEALVPSTAAALGADGSRQRRSAVEAARARLVLAPTPTTRRIL